MTPERRLLLTTTLAKLFPGRDPAEVLRRIARNAGGMFRFEYQEPRPLNGRTTLSDADFLPLLFLANVGAEALELMGNAPMLPAREGAGLLQGSDARVTEGHGEDRSGDS